MLESNVDGLILEPTQSALPNPNKDLYQQITQSNIPAEVKKGILFHFTGPRKPWNRTLRWRVKKCSWVKHCIMARIGGGVIAERLLNMCLLTLRPFLNLFVRDSKTKISR